MSTSAEAFEYAFERVLARDPSTAPGPSLINRELGRSGGNQLNGRNTKLRIQLLENHGFVKDSETGRWVKR